MKIKIKILKTSQKPEYPYFGIYEEELDHIVLFTAPKKGIVVYSDYGASPIGYESNTMAEEKFIPFYGKIIVKPD